MADVDVDVELGMVLDEDNTDEAEDEVVDVAEVVREEVVIAVVEDTDTVVVGVAVVVREVVREGVAVVEGGATVVVVCGVGLGSSTVAGSVEPPKTYNVPNGI